MLLPRLADRGRICGRYGNHNDIIQPTWSSSSSSCKGADSVIEQYPTAVEYRRVPSAVDVLVNLTYSEVSAYPVFARSNVMFVTVVTGFVTMKFLQLCNYWYSCFWWFVQWLVDCRVHNDEFTGRLLYRTTTKSTLNCFHSMQKGLGLGLGWRSDLVVFPNSLLQAKRTVFFRIILIVDGSCKDALIWR